jgi:mannose-6-phosphate isomerase-like protein (cupin superfamily)
MKRSFVFGMFLGAAITVIAFVASSETDSSLDPVKVSPQYYKVLLENDQVRVLEYHLKPGEKESLHSHLAGVVYSFSDGKLKSTMQDGNSREASAKAGQVMWRDPVTHAIDNTGSTELHALAIELKKTCN